MAKPDREVKATMDLLEWGASRKGKPRPSTFLRSNPIEDSAHPDFSRDLLALPLMAQRKRRRRK